MVDSHDGGARGDRENLDHRFRALEMHIVEVDGKVDALATLMIQRFDGVAPGSGDRPEGGREDCHRARGGMPGKRRRDA